MKKTYTRPFIEMDSIETGLMICASGSVISSGTTDENEITYGGVDEEGTLEPASRRHDLWEDEEEY